MVLSRVRPQMRMVLAMLGRIKTQNLQRRIQVPLVILEKIRTLLLTLSILYPNFGRYIRSTREEAEV